MSTRTTIKLAGLNIGLALINIILFSPGILNIRLGGTDALGTAIGATAIVMSIVIFVYGNYRLVSRSGKPVKTNEVKTLDDCTMALKQAFGKKTFDNGISSLVEQVERLEKRKEKIRTVLLQKFNIIDAGFERFNGILTDVEFVFCANIQSILNKINAFDEEDYEKIRRNRKAANEKYVLSRLGIYNEYIVYVKNATEENEKILLKLDMLLLELSKIDTFQPGEIENMKEIREMDELIRRSTYYR